MSSKSILRSPVITEKASVSLTVNKYVFYVDPSMNKIQIANAVKKEFGVKVLDVNIMVVKGKVKGRGRVVGKRPDRKKAIVTLAPGEHIAAIKELF